MESALPPGWVEDGKCGEEENEGKPHEKIRYQGEPATNHFVSKDLQVHINTNALNFCCIKVTLN